MITPLSLLLIIRFGETALAAKQNQTPVQATPQQGKIPPRDPRLVPPAVQETSVPPNVKVPAPPPGEAVAGTPVSPITADEAARIALRLQPNIGIAQAGITVQQGLTRQLKSALLPQITTLTSYTQLQSLSGPSAGATGPPKVVTLFGGTTGLATSVAASATLSQLVFDFNHALNLVRQSAALEKAAAQTLSAVQSDTVLQVKQAFYLLVQSLQQVHVDELDVANRQAQLDLARSRYNVGLGIPSDVVTAETAKAEAIVGLSQIRAAAEQARISLALLMGIDPRTPIEPADAMEPAMASNDVNALTQMAMRQRPEVLRAKYSLSSAQYGLSGARTANSPAVSVGASVVSTGDEILPQENDLTFGISISWTPVDGGFARGQVEQARGNVAIAQKQLYAAQQNAKSDVATAYVNLRAAEEQMPAVNADVVNAELGVRIATGRYSTGVGLFLDIINAEAFLLTARTNLVNNQSAIDQYRAALAHAVCAPMTRVASRLSSLKG